MTTVTVRDHKGHFQIMREPKMEFCKRVVNPTIQELIRRMNVTRSEENSRFLDKRRSSLGG